ncbi:vesicle-associated membrane protein 7-like isoform X1 [Ostrinia furnacalis]|uniref:vesicle-associated membrane protein 7-like isoform X1 n=2 Tax=Ostrinia furnacalis TaxID=93504 RepID=UPI00103E53DD|nr:vesicle-associated membrane protein 7-like isoform X1 [Ostrinia furnacalis]
MPILFSAVACDKNVVSNFASCGGNFMEIMDQVLTKIPENNQKMTYAHGHYLFHYIVADKYFYFCVTDKLCQRSRAFLFLNEIQRRFIGSDKCNFSAVLADEMYRYSEDYSTITIRKGELDELNSIGVGCSETLLGEKILLVNNVDNLSFSTISYVGKNPEQVIVTVKDSRLYYIIGAVLVLALGIAMCIFGPISQVILTGALLFSLYHSVFKT